MNIKETSHNLQNIYQEMTKTFSEFQKEVGLPCASGCGSCCVNPEIEASILEMLPFAVKAWEEDRLEETLTAVEAVLEGNCYLFDGDLTTGKGSCRSYNERPSLCRMFGVGGYYDKNHVPTLSICKVIRASAPDHSAKILSQIKNYDVPSISKWATLTSSLGNPTLNVRMPINLAMKAALEKTALYAQYHSEND